MGTVGTAVGCAVGIPIGIGILVAVAFWYRLQRRFQRELQDDKELERAVYDESGFVGFDTVEDLKDSTLTSSDNLAEPREGSTRHGKPKNTLYIPAYRRKINEAQRNNSVLAAPPSANVSRLSIPSVVDFQGPPMQGYHNNSSRQISVYDQMVPFVAADGQKLFDIDSTNVPDNSDTQPQSATGQGGIIKNFQNQDLGSYYPMLHNPQQQKWLGSYTVSERGSSLGSVSKMDNSTAVSNNASGTPKKSAQHASTNYQPPPHSPSDLGTATTIATTPQGTLPIDNTDYKPVGTATDQYALRNNYDVDNTGMITEEDQYENEFTNYTVNRRQFLDSLRPN
ncbi:Skg1p KNAG_0C06660 [Huiozyma naganishii CBS 8797]|uniref:Suppressor of lethality of KEX2 GAS1 double null mutant protein 1 n=1 Tax=Huiozyma naganishii (strain ATCC MYA-139 / BCRC 22969 / CBS 8797 / KCTC 17520 / NBRC 10181 / NCYC 3082 / Yp74L-3) TaxID=1071383 RepID=J7RJS3_HUIN7|nr:hypothetical protein KNAG_0C06660 [Kazachstania naganishii CBS 8797]CCK69758.1 hypothetical protein KNAG_0C06660 [Kazachstania naganishii CBS 8797]